jgi:hypothetical protein
LLNASRRKRIAAGSGTSVQDVNKLVKQYQDMARMMKKLGGKTGAAAMKAMMGGMGGGMGGAPGAGMPDLNAFVARAWCRRWIRPGIRQGIRWFVGWWCTKRITGVRWQAHRQKKVNFSNVTTADERI